MTRIVVADDHVLHRRDLCIALQDAMPAAEVHAVETLDAALAILAGVGGVDIAFFDLELPGLKTLGLLCEFRRTFSATRFIVTSAADLTEAALQPLTTEPHGRASKGQTDEDIVFAGAATLSGRMIPPSAMTFTATRALSDPGFAGVSTFARGGRRLRPTRLTRRQRDVLALIVEGLSNREIAQRLRIAEPTTKVHVAALMRTLNVRNRTEAAVMARNLAGLLSKLALLDENDRPDAPG
ncbi:LuxR C-terminal-related transcriptional regulator [Hansschlegelia zhihuaiae]|uniref:Response regulator transcription factor n=1 Tax=Hansschlegelia zhihuaiae TaxID=405005 RepID=A0A4Q0MC74_9HYPH|nr:response regulator transcription factor [Hansschlegelia zhihuaiae]RXF70938.1 response regulator transcription factor [Hansschlegelia zhihuaiae]